MDVIHHIGVICEEIASTCEKCCSTLVAMSTAVLSLSSGNGSRSNESEIRQVAVIGAE